MWKIKANTNGSGPRTSNLVVRTWFLQCFDDMTQKGQL
jgi:hypothetical protein